MQEYKLFNYGMLTKEDAEEAYAERIDDLKSRYAVLTVADFNEEHWYTERSDYYTSFYDEFDWENKYADSSFGWDFEMLNNLELVEYIVQAKYTYENKTIYNYLLPEPRKLTEDEIRANKRKKLQNEIDELEAYIKSNEMKLEELKDKLNNL